MVVAAYAPPQVTELGSLGVLMQSLLPSARALGGTMAALSAPATVGVASGGDRGTVGGAESGGAAGEETGLPVSDNGGGDSERAPETDTGPAPDAGVPVAPRGALPADGGDLPFTGFAAGALAGVGAALTGAGVALRRAVRRR